jgi:hypothetical protein
MGHGQIMALSGVSQNVPDPDQRRQRRKPSPDLKEFGAVTRI